VLMLLLLNSLYSVPHYLSVFRTICFVVDY